jgi:hypothetical protein
MSYEGRPAIRRAFLLPGTTDLPRPALRAEHEQPMTHPPNSAMQARAGVRLCFPSSG